MPDGRVPAQLAEVLALLVPFLRAGPEVQGAHGLRRRGPRGEVLPSDCHEEPGPDPTQRLLHVDALSRGGEMTGVQGGVSRTVLSVPLFTLLLLSRAHASAPLATRYAAPCEYQRVALPQQVLGDVLPGGARQPRAGGRRGGARAARGCVRFLPGEGVKLHVPVRGVGLRRVPQHAGIAEDAKCSGKPP